MELKTYKCKKVVKAAFIMDIDQDRKSLLVENSKNMPEEIWPGDEYFEKHKPEKGGYFVLYEDGYKSWSPAKVFEEGYDQIDA